MMIKPVTTHRRAQSAAEEILNSVSHGVGLAAAVIALPFLLAAAEGRGGSAATIGAGAFAFTVILLYLSSALYHYLPESAGKRVFRLLDHGAIFVLIAGTYTPFTLGVLRGAWGWTLLSLVWAFAVKSEFASATQLGKLTVAGSAPRQL